MSWSRSGIREMERELKCERNLWRFIDIQLEFRLRNCTSSITTYDWVIRLM